MVARTRLNIALNVHCLSCDFNTPLFGKLYRVDGTRMKYMENGWNDFFILSLFLSLSLIQTSCYLIIVRV
jgi:hypothetical protein